MNSKALIDKNPAFWKSLIFGFESQGIFVAPFQGWVIMDIFSIGQCPMLKEIKISKPWKGAIKT